MCGTRLSTKQLDNVSYTNINKFFKEPSRFFINNFMESLILAQDERWRRA